jgi:hypothetical protein
MGDLGPFLITWGLFRALEATCEHGELPDPTVDELFEAAEGEIGVDGLLSGWGLVAARLRQALVEHAETVGCDCGSEGWMEREQLLRVAQEPP